LVFNKVDLLQGEEMQARLQDYVRVYEAAGYPCVQLSANQPTYAEQIRELLRGKVSCVVGRSGAGKSSLVNLADPGLDLKTGDISDFSGRGKHTTTFAEMHELSFGGFIIDSPGFKEMELIEISKQELGHFFPEFRARLSECRFNNCQHSREPGCAIKAAVADGEIAESRYHTYLSMLESAE
jgi:ribosome biogenesis GTPase